MVQYPPRFDPAQNRLGVCSNYLSSVPSFSSNSVDGIVPCYVWHSIFRLPNSPLAPIIGIAGGTGVAPFMAFIEEREEMRSHGMNKFGPFELYYGVRDPTEFAYGPEILKVERGGGCVCVYIYICMCVCVCVCVCVHTSHSQSYAGT